MEISKDQFEVFIMVYAAYADFEERPLETRLIIDKFGEKRYMEAFELYHSLKEYERVQIIIQHLEDFRDESKKQRILTTVRTLLNYDGFNRFEASFYSYLSKVTAEV